MSASSPASTPAAADIAAELAAVKAELAELREVLLALPEALATGSRPAAGHAADDERALTTAGVMDALSIGRTRLYELIREGHLTPVKMGRGLRFPAAQVRALIRRGTSPRKAR